MRILLDTNILIHREASTVVKKDIGVLFNWLDKLKYDKCIHPCSIEEIKKHKDPKVRRSFEAKLASYIALKTEAPETSPILALRTLDKDENDRNDTSVLKELFANRVDFLITEDRGIHRKALQLKISDRVFTIDDFLEKVTSENPELADYKILSVERAHFGDVDLSDPFFDSFKRDYIGFAEWFNKKSDEFAYICKSDANSVLAFLYLKMEEANEPYPDINPAFSRKRRLKIGTFKVTLNGFKLGERFLKIVFDNALRKNAQEIYVTVFNEDEDQKRLIKLLQDWGFSEWGKKESASGTEIVLVRGFAPAFDVESPRMTFPYISRRQRKFIVPIWPDYHTELLPDSILKTENPKKYVDNRPNRNALRKVYISRSIRRDLERGDVIIFYRTASEGQPAHFSSVATTLGIVEAVHENIRDFETFVRLCRKRSVFTDNQLKEHWDRNTRNRPFILEFLYNYSLPKRPNLATLKENNIITEYPRGFEEITDAGFQKLLELSDAEKRLVVD